MDSNDQSPKKWRRRKDSRPREIVEAALDAFAEKGFAATRLEDVAKSAGISKGTLYLYFDDKEDLFKAVIQQALIPNIASAEERLTDTTGSTQELLHRVVGHFVSAVAGSKLGVIPKLVISEAHNFPDITKFYADEVIARGLKIVRAIILRGIERGEIRAIDPEVAAPILIGPLLLLMLWKNVFEPHSGQKIDSAAYIRTYEDILLNGLLEPAAKEGRS